MAMDSGGAVLTVAQSLAKRLGVGSSTPLDVSLSGGATAATSSAGVREALVDAVVEIFGDTSDPEGAAEHCLRAVREVLGASCAALWLYTGGTARCVAEAGLRPIPARHDLLEQTRLEQRPVYGYPESGSAVCLVPIKLSGESLGAIEVVAASEEWSSTTVRALTVVARMVGEFVGRVQADARAEASRRLLADVLEELDEGVMVASDDGAAICSNSMMTRLLAVLDPAAEASDSVLSLLQRIPPEDVLQEDVVVHQTDRARRVAIRGRRLAGATPPLSVIVANPGNDEGEAEAQRSRRLRALDTLSVEQGEDIARLASAVVEHLREIESGPAREALEAAGHLATLSTARKSASGVAALGTDVARARRSKAVALVVEDEDGPRRALERMLTKGGYYVVAAAHAEDALTLAAKYAGLIDLVISDLVLPRMSGQRLLHELAQSQPRARHLLVSGKGSDELVYVGRSGRPLPFLAKPFSYKQLTAAVERLLGQSPQPTTVE